MAAIDLGLIRRLGVLVALWSFDARADSASPIDGQVSSQVGGYGDTNHVFVVSPAVAGTVRHPTAGWQLDGSYLVDVVSAASVDIVSTASRRWSEIRQEGTLGGTYKPGTFGVGLTSDVSIEPDYESYTFGGSVQKDLLDKNLSLSVGYEHRHNIAGRRGTPFSVFSRVIDHDAVKGGLTWTFDKATLVSVVSDTIFERGDTSKPYRYVPLFAPDAVVPLGASGELVNRLRTPARALEQLPTTRNRYALAGHFAHRFEQSTLRIRERLYTDSWGLQATTTEVRWLVDLTERFELGPLARLHLQSPVVFWQRAYRIDDSSLPALRTGDRELGPLTSLTLGGTLRLAVGATPRPRAWILGLDFSATQTWYHDDLYLRQRLSAFGALVLEAEL